MATYEHIHRFRDDRLKPYLERPKRAYQRISPQVWEKLLIENKDLLFPCNAEARIDFARIVLQARQDFGVDRLEPHHFVSFAPANLVLPLSQARNFDVRKLQATLRQALGRIPFLGMIEAALYKGWGSEGPTPGEDHVSWHAHLIVWRTEKAALERALKPLRNRCANMYDRPAVHVCKLAADQIDKVLLYIHKGQIKAYRVNQTPGQRIDSESGELWHHTRQQKSWMRTGDHLRMCEVFENLRLTDLSFGNGDGTWLARHIRCQAMKPFCRWAAQENARLRDDDAYPEVRANRALEQKLAREVEQIRAAFPYAQF